MNIKYKLMNCTVCDSLLIKKKYEYYCNNCKSTFFQSIENCDLFSLCFINISNNIYFNVEHIHLKEIYLFNNDVLETKINIQDINTH